MADQPAHSIAGTGPAGSASILCRTAPGSLWQNRPGPVDFYRVPEFAGINSLYDADRQFPVVAQLLVGSCFDDHSDPVITQKAYPAFMVDVELPGAMIFYRYLAVQIFKATFLVLFILVGLSLFFNFIQEMKGLGRGQYGLAELIQYLVLRIPVNMVDYLPLAAVVGSTLSLGSLASTSELIAFQSAGVSIKRFILAVVQAVLVLALLSMVLTDFVVPYSETRAKQFESSNMRPSVSIYSRQGVWIKDEGNIVFIGQLFPNGNAQNIRINQLDNEGNLLGSIQAEQAVMKKKGWLLSEVRLTELVDGQAKVSTKNEWRYPGNLTEQLFATLVVEVRAMSISDLITYVQFLQDNGLDYAAESLMLWRKIYAPLSIVILGLMALPFVMGSQRHGTAGQRILIGLFLGLSYVVVNRILIQLGAQLKIIPSINALIPILVFAGILYVLFRIRLMKT